MGLLQKAVETYDNNEKLVGQYIEGHEVLAPVGHATTSAGLEITLNQNGEFVSVRTVDKKEPKIAFPVTEGSVGRSSGACPHPLCDQIGYLSGQNDEKYELYVEQLKKWSTSEYSHPMLEPILNYVIKKSILEDLAKSNIQKIDEKWLVRWRVNGIGEQSGACWENQSLQDAYSKWYTDSTSGDVKDLCMITGSYDVVAKQHLKGIIPANGNAKLISANDTSGFTYRGRFIDSSQSVTSSYLASQKAHNALKWLASEQGVRVISGSRTFLCWNPGGKKSPHVLSIFAKGKLENPSDYRKELRNTLNGYKNELPDGNGGIVICAFDAATTGRLALTYYNELRESDFLERLKVWDEYCSWWKRDFEEKKYIMQPPSLFQIICCAFGSQRVENGKVTLVPDDRILGQQLQRLLACRIDKMRFPADIEQRLVDRASSRQSFDTIVYSEVLYVTCAIISKYRYDYYGEDCYMALDSNRKDPSYQFGRLLAVFEKVENDTYGQNEKRETNAARLQSVFRQRPFHTANIIEEQLERAYFPRLSYGSKTYYKKLIAEIMNIIQEYPESWNKRLGDTYLLGYYLQRRELYQSKTDKNMEEEK